MSNSAIVAPGGHLRGVIAVAADISERKKLEQRLQQQAFSDALTGLANRPLFIDRINHLLTRQPRGKANVPFAVLFLDIDDFKAVNDTMGHSAGDELLVSVARRLTAALRPGDLAARLGGDEFAVLLEDAGQEEAERVARRLLADMAIPVRLAERYVVASTSIGIVVPARDTVTSAEDLLRNADLAMYGAKQRVRGSYAVYEPGMHAAAVRRLELKGDLERAIDSGEVRLQYQPIFRLSDGAAMGAEALVHWSHEERGDVPAKETLPSPSQRAWCCRSASSCSTRPPARPAAGATRSARPRNPLPFVSINVSGRELLDPAYPDRVAASCARSGLPAAALAIEISEADLMHDSEMAISALVRLKALGVRLAIDDFGTGYSSLGYLARFPLDMLKIDRSFVSHRSVGDDWAVARSIMDLARSLKLEVVAEGIEQVRQASMMTSLGADYGQGFHLGRRTTSDAVQTVLLAGAVVRGSATRRGRPTGVSATEPAAARPAS